MFLLTLLASLWAAEEPSSGEGIPIHFHLDRPGFVTIVVEDEQGRRVHNAVSGAYFPAGDHTVFWDGYDVGQGANAQRGPDFGPTIDLLRHRVPAGRYRVRGLTHEGIRLRYEMSVQSPGRPPWHTDDGSGAWLSDHSVPIAALFLADGSAWSDEPQAMISAPIAETGHACMWVTLDGRKLYGKLLGGMMGAVALARNEGPGAIPDYDAFSLGAFRGEATIMGHLRSGEHRELVLLPPDLLGNSYRVNEKGKRNLSRNGIGMVVYNGVAAISAPEGNRIVFLKLPRTNTSKWELLSTVKLPSPRGLAVDGQGRLCAIVDRRIERLDVDWPRGMIRRREPIVSDHLDAPYGIALDQQGNVYVSDRGTSHQVKVFSPAGRLLRVVGDPGGQQFGWYDERRMNEPAGLTVDSKGQVWVAEATYAPKRISVWSTDGRFLRAYYGPPKYGGGGALDPRDRSRFYYAGSGNQYLGMEFHLDWHSGQSKPRCIYALTGHMPEGHAMIPRNPPERAIYIRGRQYMTNGFNAHQRGPVNIVGIWLMEDDHIRPVAAAGFPGRWDVFQQRPIAEKLSQAPGGGKRTFFVWSDHNGDGAVQPEEIHFAEAPRGPEGMHVTEQLDFVSGNGLLLPCSGISDKGIPQYNLDQLKYVTEDTFIFRGRPVIGQNGWVILAGGPICGFQNGSLRWSLPCRWPERGHVPLPTQPGDVQGIARLTGFPMKPPAGEAGQLWAVSADTGTIFLCTIDGLVIGELGGDARTTPWLRTKDFHRGMILDHVSFREEHFWPTMTQMEDGTIYLCAGKEHSSIFRVEGLETVRRYEFGELVVTDDQLAGKPDSLWVRSRTLVKRQMTVPIRKRSPQLDGHLEDWPPSCWQDLPMGVRAALCVAGDRLYAAFQTGDPERLRNSGSSGWQELFATGGGLDVCLRSDPQAKPEPKQQRHHRQVTAAAGDLRIFITREGDPLTGPWRAVLLQQIGGGGPTAVYESPIRSQAMDTVKDVTDQVQCVQEGGNYEVAIPLALLAFDPSDGLITKGDLGVFWGSGGETRARFYWGSGSANIVSDVPSEAELTPHRWGEWLFRAE